MSNDRIRTDAPLVPLWEVVGNLVQSEPIPSCMPCHWSYERRIRPALLQAGKAVTAAEAERRVLLLANPALANPVTTPTVTAGFQLINGAELADSHRHTQSALRVFVEGGRGYTAVNGERLAMERGDLILTPSFTWHDHENLSDDPMIWLDGLDVPLMKYLSVSFYEEFAGGQIGETRPTQFSEFTFGRGLTPMQANGSEVTPSLASPCLRYPYHDARQALCTMQEAGETGPRGYSLQYTNTQNGGHVLPTIAASLHLLPRALSTASIRQTDCEIVLVLEGRGRTKIGDETIEWEPSDVFVVPNWIWNQSEATEDAVLFSFSDRAMQEKLGIWRQQVRKA